jgi:hypothetical protein
MTKLPFPFVIVITGILLLGESLLAQASPARQRVASQSNRKVADEQERQVPEENDQALPKGAARNKEQWGSVARATVKHRPSKSRSKPVPSHPLHLSEGATPSSRQPNATASVPELQQPGSRTGRLAPPNIPIGTRLVPLLPTAGISGHQFKNSHDPGAKLEAAGGPLVTAGGTAALNGSNMKRKP